MRLIIVVACCCVLRIIGPGNALGQQARPLPGNLDATAGQQGFSSQLFQSAIRSESGLADLAERTNYISDDLVSFGFSASSAEARFFVLGTLYSQALAYAGGGDPVASSNRLKAIEREFIGLEAPSSLYSYVVRVRNVIETGRYPREVEIDFLGALEPFLADFAKSWGKNMPVLLHAGSWLNDFGMAAAADDRSLLGQNEKLKYFGEEMRRLEAPKQVTEALNKLVSITEAEKIGDGDVKEIQELIRQIQAILG